MTDIHQLKKDFKSHMSVEEVLIKHKLTLKDAIHLCSKNNSHKTNRRYNPTGEDYVRKYGNKYVIRRNINGKQEWYGSYKTLNDAVVVRDCLNEEGWDKNTLKSIRKRIGV